MQTGDTALMGLNFPDIYLFWGGLELWAAPFTRPLSRSISLSSLPPFHRRTHPLDPSARINQFSIPGEIIQKLFALHLQHSLPLPPASLVAAAASVVALVDEYHCLLRSLMSKPWHARALFQKYNGYIFICMYLGWSIHCFVTLRHHSVILW